MASRLKSIILAIALACLAGAVPPARGADLDARHTIDDRITVALRVSGESAPLVADLLAWTHRSLTIRAQPADADENPAAREIPWVDLDPTQAFELRRRLMDPMDSDQWLMLGVLMLDMNDEDRADRAFAVARNLSPDAAGVEKRALALHAAGKSAQGAMATDPEPKQPPTNRSSKPSSKPATPRSRAAIKGNTGPDTARATHGAAPWPTLTDEQRAVHTRALRKRVAAMLAQAGFSIEPVETSHFLLYSELSPSETKRWAGKLDEMYATLLRVLGMSKDAQLFDGRCVIVILGSRERFLSYEAAAMGFDASAAGGVCHQQDGDTFVDFYRQSNDIRFQTVLIHETTHAFMYRYRSPAQLPTWANEGLADYVAGWLTPASQEPHEYWQHCRNFVHAGKSATEIMAQSYVAGTWYTKDSYPVSEMLVRFMLKYQPRAFKQWIDDIKRGVSWRTSMADRFGVTPEILADGFAKDIASERHYTRLN